MLNIVKLNINSHFDTISDLLIKINPKLSDTTST
jgi:hypothetical protein